MVDLKRCPFCGGEARLLLNAKRKIYGKDEYRTGVVACCNVCEARMFYGSEKLAIEAWNRRVEQQWIPVKMRPMDSEEREYWEEHVDFPLTDEIAQTFDCPMPNDGQRIWVQTKNGFVFDDVCDSDCDGIGLEGNGDWDDIIAWMPMNVPEPWKGENDD